MSSTFARFVLSSSVRQGSSERRLLAGGGTLYGSEVAGAEQSAHCSCMRMRSTPAVPCRLHSELRLGLGNGSVFRAQEQFLAVFFLIRRPAPGIFYYSVQSD